MTVRELVKRILKYSPIALTKNQQYDRQTKRVIRKVCQHNTNTVDVGCHKGEILDILLEHAPDGVHYGFEPIPDLFHALEAKYSGFANCHIFDFALSDVKGSSAFNLVLDDPALSGLKKRAYNASYHSQTIEVKTERLDDIIPATTKVGLIKIDVEGGELQVLMGASELICRNKPVIIFEHGQGASEFYGTRPEHVFDLLEKCGLKVSLMSRWLKKGPALPKAGFIEQYQKKVNYYFIAYPG